MATSGSWGVEMGMARALAGSGETRRSASVWPPLSGWDDAPWTSVLRRLERTVRDESVLECVPSSPDFQRIGRWVAGLARRRRDGCAACSGAGAASRLRLAYGGHPTSGRGHRPAPGSLPGDEPDTELYASIHLRADLRSGNPGLQPPVPVATASTVRRTGIRTLLSRSENPLGLPSGFLALTG